jgi:Flp pilus assembly pilin Flp
LSGVLSLGASGIRPRRKSFGDTRGYRHPVSDRLHRREGGQGLAEYALILALIAIIAIVALILNGGGLPDAYAPLMDG